MDGWVTIGTKLDTKQLERDLNNAQKRLVQYEKEAEQLTTAKAKAEVDLQPYEEAKTLIQEQADADLKLAQTEEEVNRVLADENKNLQEINSKYAERLGKLDSINKKIQENAINQSLATKQVEDLQSKLGESNIYDNINTGISKISNSLTGVIRKVGRWTLAVFGVRSAYSMITRAMSILSEYNGELANKLQGIRVVLATALEPVINHIISVVQRVVAYIAYIYKAWFGIDILAKSTAKSMGAGAGAAEKMRKSLAGFDEMNVLGDNVSSAGGGVGGTGLDLSDIENIQIPKWIKWIAQNKKTILNFLKGLLGVIAAFKLAKFIADLANAGKALGILGKSADSTSGQLSGLQKFGIALAIAGFVTMVASITDLIRNWDTLTTKEKAVKMAFVAIGDAAIALGYALATGFSAATLGIGALIAVIATLATALINLGIKYYEERDIVMDLTEAENNLKKAKEKLTNAYLDHADAVDKLKEKEEKLIEVQKETNISATDLITKIKEQKLTYEQLTEAEKQVYKAYYEVEAAQEKVESTTDNVTAATKESIDAQFDEMRVRAMQKGSWDEYKQAVLQALKEEKISTEEATDYMNKALKDMDLNAMITFTKDIPESVKKGMDPSQYNTNWELTKSWFKNGWDGLIANLKTSWNAFTSWFGRNNKLSASVTTSGMSTGGIAMKKGGIAMKTGGIVKLASGAVVNRPGYGIPIRRNVYAGEAGPEGVIPLTDSQRMELLGESIGRYVNINATVPVYVGNRQIAREIKKISAEDDFAYNA